MDGDIAVESEPGMGSIFTVRIPMYQAVESAPEIAALAQKPFGLRSTMRAWKLIC